MHTWLIAKNKGPDKLIKVEMDKVTAFRTAHHFIFFKPEIWTIPCMNWL